MQAIKEKLQDMKDMRKATAEAREEEKVEKELAKARLEVAHEVRMAKEAEVAKELHISKAAEKVAEHERMNPTPAADIHEHDSSGGNASSAPPPGYSKGPMYGGNGAATASPLMDTKNENSMLL